MAGEMMHLHLFPTSLPTNEIKIVVNAFRGNPNNDSKRDQLEAAWWVAGYGLSMVPDSHPVMGTGLTMEHSGEQAATELERLLDDAEGHRAVPWGLILPLVLRLIERLLS